MVLFLRGFEDDGDTQFVVGNVLFEMMLFFLVVAGLIVFVDEKQGK